jgi:hypothetical protein
VLTDSPARRNDTTAEHHHCRDYHYCAAILPPPLAPTKPLPKFLFGWATAVLHQETLYSFAAAHPDEFR